MNSFYLGIDVGGTNVRVVIYDEYMNCIKNLKKLEFKKSGNSKQEVNKNICELIESVINEKHLENKELKGIGLSVAALFDRGSGDITIWPNNRVWDGFPLKGYLTERFNVPVLLEDDANSAAVGEHLVGAGKGHSNLAYITISTGVGCGLILNNSLYIGSNGWAGEIGHIRVDDDGPKCKCGMNGCLQSLVSGPALLNKYKELKMLEDSKFVTDHDLKDVVNLAHNGDSIAKEVFLQAGAYIGKMIGSIVMLLDIPLVVLGGGVIDAGEILMYPINDTLNNYLFSFKRNIEVKKAQINEYNGAIGALNLIYRYLNNGISIQI